jgi:hypothetical protein
LVQLFDPAIFAARAPGCRKINMKIIIMKTICRRLPVHLPMLCLVAALG